MGNMTPGQIFMLAIGGLLALAGFINTVGSAAEKISKFVHAVKAPNDDLKADVEELKEWRAEVDRKLTNDHTELKSFREGNQAIFQALLALLDHGIDGNNIAQMEIAKEAVRNHLIKH